MVITTITIITVTAIASTASSTVLDAAPAIRTTATTMPEAAGGKALLKLLLAVAGLPGRLLFSYSHGLERAVEDRLSPTPTICATGWQTLLRLRLGLERRGAVRRGQARAHEGGGDLARGWPIWRPRSPARESAIMESTLQGAAFLKAAGAWPASRYGRRLPAGLAPICVAVGAVARRARRAAWRRARRLPAGLCH